MSLDTFADIDANMHLVQESMNRASGDELKALARRLEELKKLRSEMEKQLRPLPKTAAEVSTSGDIDAQISLYSEMQQDADAQGVWEFQKRIEELNKKKYTVEVGMRLPEMQRTLDELAGLDGKQLTVKLQAIGLDEMQAKIKDIEKILANPGSLSPDLLKELQRQLVLWKKYHKDVEQTDTVLKNMEGMSSAAGAIDRLGQSFKNLSSESKGLQAAIAGVSLAASLAQMVATMVEKAKNSMQMATNAMPAEPSEALKAACASSVPCRPSGAPGLSMPEVKMTIAVSVSTIKVSINTETIAISP